VRSTTVAIAALLAASAIAACGDNLTLDGPLVDRRGGSIQPPGCDYTITTRDGAEAPAIGAVTVGVDPTVVQVHLGLVGDPRTSMVVSWRSLDDVTTAGTVAFGVDAGLGTIVPGLTFSYRAGFGNGAVVRMHEAHLCGLSPDTEYSYQITADPNHHSPIYHFRTAPDLATAADAEVVIAAVGDSRGGYDVWARVVAQIAARSPDLVLFSGDAVTFGQLQPEWDAFFTAGEPLFSHVPVVAIHGNHEINAINFYAQFAMPGDEENFSFDYGAAHLIVLNDSPDVVDDVLGRATEFLTADLDAHRAARWQIVNHHRPMYSSAARHGSDLVLRAAWGPILDAHHVDLVLNGHEHDYERTFPMRADVQQASTADGTVYVVSGGAGAELYENGNERWTARSASVHSATVVRVRHELLELSVFDDVGAAVDHLVIDKP
jgi:acid phosphatase type 7